MKRLALALLLITCPAAWAQAQKKATPAAAASPAAVVRELYRVHRNGYGQVFTKAGRKHQRKFFDDNLAGLLWKDLTETPQDEVGRLDGDPLYNAQEMKITRFRIGAGVVTGDTASVPVTFQNFDRKEHLDFRLVKTAAGWKITNIVYGADSDLLKILSGPM